MRYFYLALFLLGNLWWPQAQPTSIFLKPRDTTTYGWQSKKEVGLYFNQVSFTNWNAGGVNSISGRVTGQFEENYKAKKFFWNSRLQLRYGVNSQESQGLRKTEDVIELVSNFGYESHKNSNWFYSARFSFNTQFSNGFNYPDTRNPISRFMAPGYLFFGAGMEYGRHIDKLSFYGSPLTLKTTFVFDQDLANSGAFGVDPAIYDMSGNIVRPGKNIRQELGILLTNTYQHEVAENVSVNSRLSLYTDYINSFGNIDIDWELMVNMTVNSYIKATIGSHLRYDNDIKTEIEKNEVTNVETVIQGAKLQWKQLLGIGVVVDLDTFIAATLRS